MNRFLLLLMSKASELKSWLHAVTHRKRLEQEMEAELRNHLECLTDELVRAGQPPEEATRRAHIALGAITVQKEKMRASLGLSWWDELRADLRYGMRMLC